MGARRRFTRLSGAARRAALPAALAFCLVAAAAAQPVATLTELPGGLAEGYAVLDIRPEDDCYDGTLPGARCLPAAWLLEGDHGAPIGFHALRWLFGTLGLTGQETLVVYAGAAQEDALAVAALAYLAGQNRVLVLTGAPPAATDPGAGRSFSREAVYTAPMRVAAMTVSPAAGDLRHRLTDFARNGGTIAFAPQN